MSEMDFDERVMLLRVAEQRLTCRNDELAWETDGDSTELANGERELLQCLYRQRLIRLPEQDGQVTLTEVATRIARETRVFGPPAVDGVIDETAIRNALAGLQIPQITAYLKQGLPLQFLVMPRRDGISATYAAVRLPAGVTAERIAARRSQLAAGLRRLADEVQLTTGSEQGVLELRVADQGALTDA